MEKLTLSISPEDWGTLVTKYNSDSQKVKISDFTDGTVNIDTDVTGSVTKCKGSINYNGTALAAAPKDQFEAIFSDGARHLLVVQSGEVKYSSGDTIFNTVVNGTGFSAGANFEFATTQDRVYGGNAVNSPIVYDRATSYGGVSYTAPRIKTAGAQAPGTAPTAGAPTAGGNVPNGAHTYKITFLYYESEESNGSAASGVQTAAAGNNTIPLTAIPVGGYGVVARKIYRDNNDGLYLHIATLNNNTATTFSDTISVGVTPTEIPQFNNAPPSFGLVTLWTDKLWGSKVPGDPYTLFYSETSMPDIFRPENQILCNQEDPITAHIVYFDRLIVFNRRSLGQILGKTPDTFRYAAIPSSIGCVDNRTLQTRVVEGVPILIWLSDRGFYSYDGNSINYISDPIEDLVNFNIQQAVQQKNSNTQTTQSHFSGGTASQGIDLTSVPGSILTKGYSDGTSVAGNNPRRNFDDQGDWEAGLTQTNIATKDGTNLLKAPTRFAPTLQSGQLTTLVIDSNLLKLTTTADFTGETHVNDDIAVPLSSGGNTTAFAQPVSIPRAGVLNQIQIKFNGSPIANTYQIMVWADSLGSPGTVLFTGAGFTASNNLTRTESPSLTIGSAQTIWIGAMQTAGSLDILAPRRTSSLVFAAHAKVFRAGSWLTTLLATGTTTDMALTYGICQSTVSASGQWTSGIYDTFSGSIGTSLNIAVTSTFPSGSFCSGPYSSSGTITVEGSNDSLFLSGAQVSEIVNNLNGNQNIAISGKRYWRIRIALSTTDDRVTPTSTSPVLKFSTTGTFVSQTIDVTSDVTTLNSLTTVESQPSGTSVVYTVATSADDISYPDGFVTFGTQVNRRYVRIRAILTTTSDNITTPSVSSIILKWTVVSNLISSGIDTAVVPPAGWDVFLSSDTSNGGTITYQMRSATTLGGLSSATFFTVTPGFIPSLVTPLQFVQWKVIITSSDTHNPQVDSVTVQWLIALINSIRPASIFTEGRYYVALATAEQTTNNILLCLDLKAKWRRRSDLSIATFSYFFNRPYLGLATSGQIRKFLEGNTNAGTAIPFDVRTKDVDYSTQYQDNSSKVKVVGEVVLSGVGTGATLQVSYSVDQGSTFIPMITSSGSSSYVSTSDNKNFFVRFRPTWDGTNPISGRTIMYRVSSSDINSVEITGLETVAFLRTQAPVITG